MGNIAVSNDIYNNALEYARKRDTTLSVIVEGYLKKLIPSMVTKDEAEAKLQQLIGLTKGFHLNPDDINGDRNRGEYLKEKYAL